MSAFAVLWLFAIGIGICAPGIPAAAGYAHGVRNERRRIVRYLRALKTDAEPRHLATRIEAGAHRPSPLEEAP